MFCWLCARVLDPLALVRLTGHACLTMLIVFATRISDTLRFGVWLGVREFDPWHACFWISFDFLIFPGAPVFDPMLVRFADLIPISSWTFMAWVLLLAMCVCWFNFERFSHGSMDVCVRTWLMCFADFILNFIFFPIFMHYFILFLQIWKIIKNSRNVQFDSNFFSHVCFNV